MFCAGIVPTACGAPPTTVTDIDCVADPPAARAVTATEVLPALTGVIVTSVPLTPTVTIPVLPDSASIVKPPGANALATSTVTGDPLAERETGATVPTALGGLAATVTRTRCSAEPLAFSAVTNTKVLPAPTGVIVTTVPATLTVTTRVSTARTLKLSPAPVKALATFTSPVDPPADSESAASVPTARGAPGPTTETWARCRAWPLAFSAVTVSVVLPGPTGVTVTTVPLTDAVATCASPVWAVIVSPAPLNAAATSTSTEEPPTVRGIESSVPTASGAEDATVTETVWVAEPLPSRAVTTTDVSPSATG